MNEQLKRKRDAYIYGQSVFPTLRLVAADGTPGQLLSDLWSLTHVLGTGGEAAVFRLKPYSSTTPDAALKLLRKKILHDQYCQARLRLEAERLTLCTGAHVIGLQAMACHPTGEPALLLDLAHPDGCTLEQRAIQVPPDSIDINQITHWFKMCLQGLERLHMHGVAHRDLKGTNFCVTAGDECHVKLVDLSMSTLGHENLDLFYGTPHYWAPEVLDGARDLFKEDLYALCLILSEMLLQRVHSVRNLPNSLDMLVKPTTKRLLCDGVLQLHQELGRAAPAIPRPLVSFIQMGTGVRATDRYHSIHQMQEAFENTCNSL